MNEKENLESNIHVSHYRGREPVDGQAYAMKIALSKQIWELRECISPFMKMCQKKSLFCLLWVSSVKQDTTDARLILSLFEQSCTQTEDYQRQEEKFLKEGLDSKSRKEFLTSFAPHTTIEEIQNPVTLLTIALTFIEEEGSSLSISQLEILLKIACFSRICGCAELKDKLFFCISNHIYKLTEPTSFQLSNTTISFLLEENSFKKILFLKSNKDMIKKLMKVAAIKTNCVLEYILIIKDIIITSTSAHCLLTLIKILTLNKICDEVFDTHWISDVVLRLSVNDFSMLEDYFDSHTQFNQTRFRIMIRCLNGKSSSRIEASALTLLVGLSRESKRLFLKMTLIFVSSDLNKLILKDIFILLTKVLKSYKNLLPTEEQIIFMIAMELTTQPLQPIKDIECTESILFCLKDKRKLLFEKIFSENRSRTSIESKQNEHDTQKKIADKVELSVHLEDTRKVRRNSSGGERYLSGIEESTIFKYFRQCHAQQNPAKIISSLFNKYSCSTHSSRRYNKLGTAYLSNKDWLKLCLDARILPRILSNTDCGWMFQRTKMIYKQRVNVPNNEIRHFNLDEFRLAICFLYTYVADRKGANKDTFETFLELVDHTVHTLHSKQLPQAAKNSTKQKSARRKQTHRQTKEGNSYIASSDPDNLRPRVSPASLEYNEDFINNIKARLKEYNGT